MSQHGVTVHAGEGKRVFLRPLSVLWKKERADAGDWHHARYSVGCAEKAVSSLISDPFC